MVLSMMFREEAKGKQFVKCIVVRTAIAPADEAYYSFIDPVRMKG